MKKVAIIDYGMCNLDSVARAVEECGGEPLVTHQAADIETATHIILPGVGAFPEAMANIRQRSLDLILREHAIEKQIPFLGICLGMQLLAARGFEGEEVDGLGWIDADCVRLEGNGSDIRIPHIGWNEVALVGDSPLFDGIPSNSDFYFVHSYHLSPRRKEDVQATTLYGKGFVSAVQCGSVFGVQFHPEKSQRLGFKVLKNFLRL